MWVVVVGSGEEEGVVVPERGEGSRMNDDMHTEERAGRVMCVPSQPLQREYNRAQEIERRRETDSKSVDTRTKRDVGTQY